MARVSIQFEARERNENAKIYHLPEDKSRLQLESDRSSNQTVLSVPGHSDLEARGNNVLYAAFAFAEKYAKRDDEWLESAQGTYKLELVFDVLENGQSLVNWSAWEVTAKCSRQGPYRVSDGITPSGNSDETLISAIFDFLRKSLLQGVD